MIPELSLFVIRLQFDPSHGTTALTVDAGSHNNTRSGEPAEKYATGRNCCPPKKRKKYFSQLAMQCFDACLLLSCDDNLPFKPPESGPGA